VAVTTIAEPVDLERVSSTPDAESPETSVVAESSVAPEASTDSTTTLSRFASASLALQSTS